MVVRELEKQKEDMFKISIEQNSRIKDMEVEKEKLLKEKEHSSQLAIVPLTAIPILVATIVGASTSETTESQTTSSSNELVKAMEDLSIQGKEIEKLKAQLKTLQEQKLKIDSSYVAKL